MEWKTFMEASSIYNIHIEDKIFCSCYFCRFANSFDSDRVERLEVYFGLYESSLLLYRRDDEISTVYEK